MYVQNSACEQNLLICGIFLFQFFVDSLQCYTYFIRTDDNREMRHCSHYTRVWNHELRPQDIDTVELEL